MAANPENAARERSRAVWDDMATGWELAREDIWANTQAVGEWLVRALDLRPGDTVLELAAGLGDTGFQAARRVGDAGHVLITDFAPAMIAAGAAACRRVGYHERRVPGAGRRAHGPGDGQRGRRRVPMGLHADDRPQRRLRRDAPGAAAGWAAGLLGVCRSPAQPVGFAHRSHPGSARALAAAGPHRSRYLRLADPDHIQKLVTRAGFAAPEIDQVPCTGASPTRRPTGTS